MARSLKGLPFGPTSSFSRLAGPLNPLVIRAASAEDLPALLALYQHLNPGDAAPAPVTARAILNQFLTYPNSAIFIGASEVGLVASCSLVVVPNLTRGGNPYGLIENVVTHTDHRYKGHGKAILRHATDAAWTANCYRVMLLTGSADVSTHAFYRAAGLDQSKTGYQIRRIPVRTDHSET